MPASQPLAEPRRPNLPKREREDNKLKLSDRAAHDWYRFVLSFPPHLVRDYAVKFGLSGKQCVLDPFCGTGTTVVEAKKLGIASIGLEANPVAAFASRTKLDWSVDPAGLLAHPRKIVPHAFQSLRVVFRLSLSIERKSKR